MQINKGLYRLLSAGPIVLKSYKVLLNVYCFESTLLGD